jgi:hypothetical protein
MMLQLNPAFTNNLIESVRAKMPALGMDLDANRSGSSSGKPDRKRYMRAADQARLARNAMVRTMATGS